MFASGSPFFPVTLNPETCPEVDKIVHRVPGQANNSYVFPGVALAIVSGGILPITDDDFLVASEVSYTVALFVFATCGNTLC